MEPAHPHDRLIRFVASRRPDAIELVRLLLPPEIAALVDYAGLEFLDGRLLDERLREQIVDMLFRLPFLSGAEAWLQLILEAQSITDADMARRTFSATGARWATWRETHGGRTLPMIITVVISHDPAGWRAATDVRDMIEVADDDREALARWMPSAPFHLFDLTAFDDSVLLGLKQNLVEMALGSLKYARDPERLHAWMRTCEGLIASQLSVRGGLEGVQALIRYWRAVTGRVETDEVIVEVFQSALRRTYPEMKEAKVQDILERILDRVTPDYREELLAAARAQGMRRGIEQGRCDVLRETLGRQIRRRFDLDALPAWLSARIAAAGSDALIEATDRVLFAERIEDVLL